MTLLKIAAKTTKQAQFAKTTLENLGIEHHITLTEHLEHALLSGDADIAIRLLSEVQIAPITGIVTTALSQRENVGEALLIRVESTDNQLFRLKSGAKVGLKTALQSVQLHAFRPDVVLINIATKSAAEILDALRGGALDAVLDAKSELGAWVIDKNGYELLSLHPREFIPAPAQGVYAWQVREENKTLRQLLKPLHHSDVAALTNVERKVLKLLEKDIDFPLGVYIERDAMSYYHAWAVGQFSENTPLVRVRTSSSTTHGLAEEIVERASPSPSKGGEL
jgi:hydroxymethylbilane synthase